MQNEQLNDLLAGASDEAIAALMKLTGGNLQKLLDLEKEEKPKAAKPRGPKKATLEQHVVGYATHCTTCGGATFKTFWMVDGVKGTGIDCLVSASILKRPSGFIHEPCEWVQLRTGRCNQCETRLSALSKEELIEIIIGKKINGNR